MTPRQLAFVFFASLMLGCGRAPVETRTAPALLPPATAPEPLRLPNSAWTYATAPLGVNEWMVCSSNPVYPGSRCALLLRGAEPDLVYYGWTSLGWSVSLVRTAAGVEFQVGTDGVPGAGCWPYPAAPCQLAFTAADRITDVWTW